MPSPFVRGRPRPANAGRRKGSQNKATKDIKEWFGKFFSSQEYRDNVKARILKGKAPHVETLGYYYLYGKPKERLQLLNGAGQELTHDDLLNTLTVRITRFIASRTTPLGVDPPEQGPVVDAVVQLESPSEAEPTDSNGHLGHVVDPGG